MKNDEKNKDMINYNLKSVIEKLETSAGQKAYLENKLDDEYIIGNITTEDLLDIGFEFIYESNSCGLQTPIYRFGNIEAIYVGQLLHVYKIA